MQNLEHTSYRVGQSVWLTDRGIDIFIEYSKSDSLKRHKAAFLQVLDDFSSEMIAKTLGALPSRGPQAESEHQQHVETDVVSQQETLVSFFPVLKTCSSVVEYEEKMVLFFKIPEIVEIEEKNRVLYDKWNNEDLITFEHAKKFNKTVIGYDYALWNPLFPDFIKIGATFRTPEIRARELSGTGVPEPYIVVAELKSRNPFGMEKDIHAHYKDERKYGKRKEFFTVEVDDVKHYFLTLTEKAMKIPSKYEEKAIMKRLRRMIQWRDVYDSYNHKQKSSLDTSNEKKHADTPKTPEISANGAIPDISKEFIEKQRLIELDRQVLEIKQQHIELDRQALEIKQQHIELDRQAGIVAAENKKRMLDLDREEFEFSEMKKKRALEEA